MKRREGRCRGWANTTIGRVGASVREEPAHPTPCRRCGDAAGHRRRHGLSPASPHGVPEGRRQSPGPVTVRQRRRRNTGGGDAGVRNAVEEHAGRAPARDALESGVWVSSCWPGGHVCRSGPVPPGRSAARRPPPRPGAPKPSGGVILTFPMLGDCGNASRRRTAGCASMIAMSITVRRADGEGRRELATVAAATFPLACPPSADPADVAAAIRRSCRRRGSPSTWPMRACGAGSHRGGPNHRLHHADSRSRRRRRCRRVSVAAARGRAVQDVVLPSHPQHRRVRTADAVGARQAADAGSAALWLGVNRNNERAQRFYRKHGFAVTGTRRFLLGESYEDDFVMVRPVP